MKKHIEKKESVQDEEAESPEQQMQELKEGTEEHNVSEDGTVHLPEEFQKAASSLISKASTRHHTAHVRRLVDDKEEEHRRKEEKGKNKKGVPSEYSLTGLGSD